MPIQPGPQPRRASNAETAGRAFIASPAPSWREARQAVESAPYPPHLALQRRLVVEAQAVEQEPVDAGFSPLTGLQQGDSSENTERRMSQGSQAKGEIDRLMVDPPNWLQWLMAMAGVVLLVGPTLAVLWPR